MYFYYLSVSNMDVFHFSTGSTLIVCSDSLLTLSAGLTLPVFLPRDLHWGNVLVRATKAKKGSFLLDGEVRSLDTKGVLVSIIDYSLSRLEIGQQLHFLIM